MMTCRDVALQLSRDDLNRQALMTRASVALHLAMCRHCRAFARQLTWLTRASRQLGDALAGELPSAFEARLQARLSRPDHPRQP